MKGETRSMRYIENFEVSIYRNVRYDVQHLLMFLYASHQYLHKTHVDVRGWRAKHVRYDISKFRNLNISKLSIRYPTLVANSFLCLPPVSARKTRVCQGIRGKNTFDTIYRKFSICIKNTGMPGAEHVRYDVPKVRNIEISIVRYFNISKRSNISKHSIRYPTLLLLLIVVFSASHQRTQQFRMPVAKYHPILLFVAALTLRMILILSLLIGSRPERFIDSRLMM